MHLIYEVGKAATAATSLTLWILTRYIFGYRVATPRYINGNGIDRSHDKTETIQRLVTSSPTN